MKLSPPSKRMILVICISASIFIVGGIAFCLTFDILPSNEALPFALGVLLTSSVNVLKIVMLERTVQKAIGMDNVNAGKNYVRLQYLLRYLITGIALVAAALTPFISIWGAVAGILTMQVAALTAKSTNYDKKEV